MESSNADDRPHQRPRFNPEGTAWDMPNNQGQAQPQGTDQTPPEPAPPGQSAPGISFEF
ncbi:hypothetical protein PF002_g30870, partial [Phytophthora fragariae]